jgi:hypothetical protein
MRVVGYLLGLDVAAVLLARTVGGVATACFQSPRNVFKHAYRGDGDEDAADEEQHLGS